MIGVALKAAPSRMLDDQELTGMSDSPANTPLSDPKARIVVRPAAVGDIPQIAALSDKAYTGTGLYGYSEGAIHGQINHFPQGQIVVGWADVLGVRHFELPHPGGLVLRQNASVQKPFRQIRGMRV